MVSMWRTGRTAVPLGHVEKIAQLLKVDVAKLFSLWFRQVRLRNDAMPETLAETLERRLITANEAVVMKAFRQATKNLDPPYSHARVAGIVTEALKGRWTTQQKRHTSATQCAT